MTLQELQQQVSKAISHGNLTINDQLLGSAKGTSFLDQYKIESIDCTGAAIASSTDTQFTVTTTDTSLKFGLIKSFDLGAGPNIIFTVGAR